MTFQIMEISERAYKNCFTPVLIFPDFQFSLGRGEVEPTSGGVRAGDVGEAHAGAGGVHGVAVAETEQRGSVDSGDAGGGDNGQQLCADLFARLYAW